MTTQTEQFMEPIASKALFSCAVKGVAALCIGLLLGFLAFSSDNWVVTSLSVCSLTFAAIQFSAMLA